MPRYGTFLRDRREKTDEIVGDVIHMGGIATLELPPFAKYLPAFFRHHQHGGHPERMRDFEIAREVLEHCGSRGIDPVTAEKALIDLRKRLGLKLACHDVEDILEMMIDREPLHDGVRMRPGTVGEDELAARQLFERRAERLIGLDGRVVDPVHIVEEIVGLIPCSAIMPRIVVP